MTTRTEPDLRHLDFLERVAGLDVNQVEEKDRSYGGSWKRRGGVGVFMMLARKWDRLENMMANPQALVAGPKHPTKEQGEHECFLWDKYDIIGAIESQITRGQVPGDAPDGTVLAEVRDLRRYLLLLEAELLSRDHTQNANPHVVRAMERLEKEGTVVGEDAVTLMQSQAVGRRVEAVQASGSRTHQTDHQYRVQQFMEKAGQEIPDQPTIPDFEVRKLRARLIFEEAMETIEAMGISIRHHIVHSNNEIWLDSFHSTYRVEFLNKGECVIEDVADGCADLSVVNEGTLLAFGIRDNPLLQEVDEANLRKFRGDAHRDEGGKWIKPSDWQPPNIAKVLEDQGYDPT